MTMTMTRIPTRAEVPVADTWNLTTLFADDAAWDAAFRNYEASLAGYAAFAGTLHQSPARLAECLIFDTARDRQGDRVGTYAMLREAEDVASAAAQEMKSRYIGAASRAAELASFIRPEILALPPETLAAWMDLPELVDYQRILSRLVRYRPHTLPAGEERLLAMQAETAQTARNVFAQLKNADLSFGNITLAGGETIELSHATYSVCLEQPQREVRRQAFHQYYAPFAAHANTFGATLAGSVRQDVFAARARNFASAQAAALFPDQVPETVYDQLVAAVRGQLPVVHRYYDVRRRALKLDTLHIYDTYVPILDGMTRPIPWDAAVEEVLTSLAPLGQDYVTTLAAGLRGRWCDRYENKGKHSGAFSGGCYDSEPYILMNYQPDVLNDLFTLTHEAGHSMHTHYSKSQPYQYANYTIFVAEVASTFNEQLLMDQLIQNASSPRERAYYINREIDSMRATLIRQTMFAEYEHRIHALAEANEPITIGVLRGEYHQLLEAYFGPGVTLDVELDLECLRIPHFYNAFYVYKYATGLAAAIALAQRVTHGGSAELAAYLGFLHAGASKDPLDVLRAAGVDLATPQPVQAALARFGKLVTELEELLPQL